MRCGQGMQTWGRHKIYGSLASPTGVLKTSLTFGINPICIQIWQRRLIAHMLHRLWWLLVQQTARPPPPAGLLLAHVSIRTTRLCGLGSRVVGDGSREEELGRHFGGGGRDGEGWNVYAPMSGGGEGDLGLGE